MDLALLAALSLLSATPPSSSDPLCARRAPCKLVETLDANLDVQGHALHVKHLSLGWASQDTATGSAFGPGRKAEGSPADGLCAANEWWLVRSGKPPRLLLATCDDGSGPSGMSVDSVQVGLNLFTHEHFNGEAQRSTESRSLQLSPLVLRSEGLCGFSAEREDRQSCTDWNYVTMVGASVTPPRCAPRADGVVVSKHAERVYSQEQLTLPRLPQVQMDEAYLREGWKHAQLGLCALKATHVVAQPFDGPEDAALKALLVAPDTLVLEVRDDHWTGPSDKWLADDHVELWLDSTAPEELNACTPPTAEQQPEQWAIRIADARVFPGYNAPRAAPQVEKVELREAGALVGYRFKVVLPRPIQGLGVLYGDSDPGTQAVGQLATGPLKATRPETFNPIEQVDPHKATCEVRGGALVVVPAPLDKGSPRTAALPPL